MNIQGNWGIPQLWVCFTGMSGFVVMGLFRSTEYFVVVRVLPRNELVSV